MTLALCASLMAQQAQKISAVNAKAIPRGKIMAAPDTQIFEELTPTLRYSPLMLNDNLYQVIGLTHYNTVTNNNARNTVSFRNNSNHAGAVWTMGSFTGGGVDRGTGVNYFDINSNDWDPNPPTSGRIENRRVGWGGHAFTESGEIVVAHDAPSSASISPLGLVISTRDNWGNGDWNQYILKGPEYQFGGKTCTGLSWPTVVSNGNTVHLVTVTEQWSGGVNMLEENYPQPGNGYKGYSTFPLYYRSLDGGKEGTWEDPVELTEWGLTDYEAFKLSADDYVFTAKGDHIVLMICSSVGFVIYFESFDNGDTWTRHEVFHTGEVMLLSNTDFWDVPVMLPTNAAVAIDDCDKIHVVYSTLVESKHDGASGPSIYYWGTPSGMVYWNNVLNDEPLNLADYCTPPNTTPSDFWGYWLSVPGHIDCPHVTGWTESFDWILGPEYDGYQFHNGGYSSFPRLIAKDDRVYVAYQSALDYPFAFENPDLYVRGIFVTVSDDNGATWDVQKNTSWISYKPDLQWANWENYIIPDFATATVDQIVDAIEMIDIEFQAEQGYPSMTMNTKGDMFMIQWLYHHLSPFPNDGNTVFEVNPMSVYTFTQNLKNLPAYKNMDDIMKGNWTNEDEPEINFPDLGCERPQKVTFETCTSEDGNEYRAAIIYWKQPEYINVPLSSYNIYRDGNKIGSVPYSITIPGRYVDKGIEVGTYTYQVSAVYEGGCESTLTRAKTFTLGDNPVYYEDCGDAVKDIPSTTFKLYPNPSNGNVTVVIDTYSSYTLTVSNIMGQVVSSMNGNTKEVQLDVSNYPPGVYIVNVKTANAITTQKLIVK